MTGWGPPPAWLSRGVLLWTQLAHDRLLLTHSPCILSHAGHRPGRFCPRSCGSCVRRRGLTASPLRPAFSPPRPCTQPPSGQILEEQELESMFGVCTLVPRHCLCPTRPGVSLWSPLHSNTRPGITVLTGYQGAQTRAKVLWPVGASEP